MRNERKGVCVELREFVLVLRRRASRRRKKSPSKNSTPPQNKNSRQEALGGPLLEQQVRGPAHDLARARRHQALSRHHPQLDLGRLAPSADQLLRREALRGAELVEGAADGRGEGGEVSGGGGVEEDVGEVADGREVTLREERVGLKKKEGEKKVSFFLSSRERRRSREVEK